MATEDNVPAPSAGEEEGRGTRGEGMEGGGGPREMVRVKVIGYQLTAKDFNYQLEVCLEYRCAHCPYRLARHNRWKWGLKRNL